MSLLDTIRAAGDGEAIRALAEREGLSEAEALEGLRALLPEIGRAVRRAAAGGRSGAAAVHAAMNDERYDRYLDDPALVREPSIEEDGEQALSDLIEDGDRSELVRRAAAATDLDEDEVRKLLPLVAVLAMAALGHHARDPSPGVPWFGSRRGDHFDAPLLDALTSLFEHKDDGSAKKR